MNLFAVFVLAKLAGSQSMGLLAAGFKNMKAARTLLTKKFPALPDAETPLERISYITRQTVAYALSLVASSVCYHASDVMNKGRS